MNVSDPRCQMRKKQKAKSPAEVAASPSHGSTPLEETMMNENDASTTSPELANRAPIYGLQTPTDDLERLSSILDRMLEATFYNPRRTREPDGLIMLPISESLIDDTLFVAHKIGKLSAEIGEAVTKAVNAHIKADGAGSVAGGAAINRLVARLKGGESPVEIVHVAAQLAREATA